MALPTVDLSPQDVKVRFGERYTSQAINKKFLSQPRGIYIGFAPVVQSGSRILTLDVDPTYGISLCHVRSSTELSNVAVATDQPVTLDFTGHDFGVDPTAYVIISASASLGGATSGSIFTRGTIAVDPLEQLVCVVTEVSGELSVAFDDPTNRFTPFAHLSAPLGYGYMKDGAVEELIAAVAMVAEVEAAREDLTGFVWPFPDGLNDRIIADLAPAAIADRLARVARVIRGNDTLVASTTNLVNVSASFTETARVRAPVVTIDGQGDEVAKVIGAITDPNDAERNHVFVLDVGTNTRPTDTDRQVAYGHLLYDAVTLTGTATFNTGITTVTGVGTAFTTEVEVGDIIADPAGLFFEVATITDDFTLDLTQVPSANGALSPARRRFTLSMVKDDGSGTEIPYSIPGGTTIRFFFTAIFDLSASRADATLEMFEGGEEVPLPDADVGVAGSALMAPGLTGALAGAVQSVLNAGAQVGAGAPVFSLNFTAASDGGGGVANVDMTGPIGPVGAPGIGVGPVGPTGTTGIGFDNFSSIFNLGPIETPPWVAGEIYAHTVTFPSALAYVHGGVALWGVAGGVMDSDDHFDIVDVARNGGNPAQATIEAQISTTAATPGGRYRLFLNGAG